MVRLLNSVPVYRTSSILNYFVLYQVNCQFGRENFDSWGRRKRDVVKRDVGDDDDVAEVVEEEAQMRLSHEIIVLDYGDERSSPYEPERKPEKKINNGNCETLNYLLKYFLGGAAAPLVFSSNNNFVRPKNVKVFLLN